MAIGDESGAVAADARRASARYPHAPASNRSCSARGQQLVPGPTGRASRPAAWRRGPRRWGCRGRATGVRPPRRSPPTAAARRRPAAAAPRPRPGGRGRRGPSASASAARPAARRRGHPGGARSTRRRGARAAARSTGSRRSPARRASTARSGSSAVSTRAWPISAGTSAWTSPRRSASSMAWRVQRQRLAALAAQRLDVTELAERVVDEVGPEPLPDRPGPAGGRAARRRAGPSACRRRRGWRRRAR